MARIDEINAEVLLLQEVPSVCRVIGAFQAPVVECEAAISAAGHRLNELQLEALVLRGELPPPPTAVITSDAIAPGEIERRVESAQDAETIRLFNLKSSGSGQCTIDENRLGLCPPPAPTEPVPAPVATTKETAVPISFSIPSFSAPAPPPAPSFLSSIVGALVDVGTTVATQVVGAAVGAGTALLTGAIQRVIAPVPTSGAPGVPIVVPGGSPRTPMTGSFEAAQDLVRDQIALAGQLQMRQAVITRSVPPNCVNPQPLLLCTPKGGATAVSPAAFRIGERALDQVRDRIAFEAAVGCR